MLFDFENMDDFVDQIPNNDIRIELAAGVTVRAYTAE
jgi:hypothetical protein